MIGVVTDSTSDISPAMAKELGIRVVPLTVSFGDEDFRDGIDLPTDQFFTRLVSSEQLPKTSQPTPAAFSDVYKDMFDHDGVDAIVSIHLSGALSGTMQSAHLAAEDFDGKVSVVDSLSISGPLEWLVRAAKKRVDAGDTVEQIVERLDTLKKQIFLQLTVDTLVYLQKGGRIGRAQALVGGLLKVKPVLQLTNGVIHPVTKARTLSQGIATMKEGLAGLGELAAVTVRFAAIREAAEALAHDLAQTYPSLTVSVVEIGPVIGTYTGPGAVAVMGLAASDATHGLF